MILTQNSEINMSDGAQTLVPRLIAQARTNREKLGELLERYRPYLLLAGQRRIGRELAVRCDAADVTQQTLADVVRVFDSFAGTSEPEFSAWIMKIHEHNLDEAVRKHIHAQKRSLRKQHRLPDATASASFCWHEPAARETTASQRLIKGEKALGLAAVLASLPDDQREAVRLRHLEGWPVEQIAAELNRSVAATAGLIKRGLQAMREKMSEDSWR